MHIPRYWAMESGRPPSARPPQVDVWGWSDTSEADARAVAQRRLAEVIARAEAEGGLPDRGDYYPRVPLREPVLTTLRGDDDATVALVTRNRYGAEVLNTEQVFVADVDVPEWEDHEPGSGGGLFRRKVVSVEEVTGRLEAVLTRSSDLAWRIYRTRAGLRVLAAGPDLEPGGIRANALLEELGADPLYVSLTRTYDSYRARLTPKPWRIGRAALTLSASPTVHGELLDADTSWIAGYDRAATEYAVCRLVSRRDVAVPPAVARVLDLHDQRTGVAATQLPLA